MGSQSKRVSELRWSSSFGKVTKSAQPQLSISIEKLIRARLLWFNGDGKLVIGPLGGAIQPAKEPASTPLTNHRSLRLISLAHAAPHPSVAGFFRVDRINWKFGRNAVHSGAMMGTEGAAPTRIPFGAIPQVGNF